MLIKKIAQELSVSEHQVKNTLDLLVDACTVPFISRYRKEATGGLDEVQIGRIEDLKQKYEELEQRRKAVLKAIAEQEKLTPELEQKILSADSMTQLEDIYLPFKQSKKTRASKAREKGLEPLAKQLMAQNFGDMQALAGRYLKNGVKNITEALQGASDIIAEWINTNESVRNQIRRKFSYEAVIKSKVVKGKEDAGEKYQDYFKWDENLRNCPSHRILALHRAQNEGILQVSIGIDKEEALQIIERKFLKNDSEAAGYVKSAIKDAYTRMLKPAIENEFAKLAKEKADNEAINVFVQNLKQLLLSPPLGSRRVLALDPGFRTGCKLVCLDEKGDLLHNDTIYPHPPRNERKQSAKRINSLVEAYKIKAIAIGSGTAGRETRDFIENCFLPKDLPIFMVDESGASIYSASKIAREEFPEYDVTVRGSVSIGRRLIDPLAELVKIDPKSIGVGQYQHEVDQKELKKSLTRVVESAVNFVGVDLNTASKELLAYISGLSAQLAQNIVEYRKENGRFKDRKELLKVKRLGNKAFEQAAGFLRISDAENPLDNSAVHPESYHIIEKMAQDLKIPVAELLENEKQIATIKTLAYVTESIGLPTIKDILSELAKPGRDPRKKVNDFSYDDRIKVIDDLEEGMILTGKISNITKFGAFVDIGIKQNGLIHISNLTNAFVSNPFELVSLNQEITVKVLEVDRVRGRIQLSSKGYL